MRRYFLAIISAFLLVLAAYAAAPDTIVYVTKTGEKYHTEGCTSLRSSKIEMSLEEAVSKGYEPCGRCKPPLLDEK